jgi:hypothetical protein
MPKETPLQAVKRLYGSKDKLVDHIMDAAKKVGEETTDAKDKLKTASNKQLLRMAEVTKSLKDKYGTRDKLVASLSSALGKAKDNDYVSKLSGFSTAKLLDMMKAREAKKPTKTSKSR